MERLKRNVEIWFGVAGGTLVTLILIYLVAHYLVQGSEIVKLSKQELIDVNLIIFGSNEIPADSTYEEVKLADYKIRRASVYRYIFSTRKPVTKSDSLNFVAYFNDFETQQFATAISNYPIRSQSYFWLTSPSIYLEVIFWSLFGLFASLFYYVSEAIRKKEFDSAEISVHIAKLIYTPLSALVIFFSINALTSSGDIVTTEFSNSTIVLSFILGFFSGRTIELLGKIKDIILPQTKPGTEEFVAKKQGIENPDVSAFSTLTLENQDELIQEYIDASYKPLKKLYPNLTGINSARKKIGGEPLDIMAISFQVMKKDDQQKPQFEKTIKFKGYNIPTDIVEQGQTRPVASLIPLEGGISRESNNDSGTIGIPVKDTSGNTLIMSCYHVLFNIELDQGKLETESNDQIGNRDVISPCFAAGGTQAEKVGSILEGKINEWLDIAVFKPDPKRKLENKFIKVPGPHGVYRLTRDDENKAYVQYFGNRTNVVCAKKVENIFSNQWINYIVNGATYPQFIKGLIQIEGTTPGGDSGAPAFDGAGNFVGTVVASDDKSTYLISARSIALKSSYTIKTI